jgi:uncharacterized membrane protein YdjX (TVP38/TMEM64 family)
MEAEAQVQGQRRKWLQIPVAIIIIAVIALGIRHYFSMYDRVNGENIQAFIQDFGVWAPVVYAFIYTISSPIPFGTVLLSPLSGLLFGTFWGTLLVISVATLSSLIPFTLARQLGREWVESKLKGKKLDDFYQRSKGQGGFLFVLVMRLVPVLPWEVQNYVAGVTQVALPVYLIATLLGIIPGSTALVLLGDSAADPTSWKFIVAVALNVLVMGSTPFIASYLRKRRQAEEGEGDEEGEENEEDIAS